MSASEPVDATAGTSRRWPGARDWVVAGVVTALQVGAPTTGSGPAEPTSAWLGLVPPMLALTLGVPLAWRRIRPGLVAAVVLGATAVDEVVVAVVPPFAAWVVLWTVIVHGRPG